MAFFSVFGNRIGKEVREYIERYFLDMLFVRTFVDSIMEAL